MTEMMAALQVEMTGAQDLLGFFRGKPEIRETQGAFWKEGCFIRYIGADGTNEQYIEEILALDRAFDAGTPYLRTGGLQVIADSAEIERMTGLFDQWKDCGGMEDKALLELALPVEFAAEILRGTARIALKKVLALYRLGNTGASESMLKNFCVKFFGWMQTLLPALYPPSQQVREVKELVFPKVVFVGGIKQHEYLFLYFLYLIGCDVLYMHPREDLTGLSDPAKSVSRLVCCKGIGPEVGEIPAYSKKSKQARQRPPVQVSLRGETSAGCGSAASAAPAAVFAPAAAQDGGAVRVQMQPRPGRSSPGVPAAAPVQVLRPAPAASAPAPRAPGEQRELGYEELALCAGSVVMLKVYDKKNECFKSGSGVIISDKGYLLTNYHVISGGDSFGIRFENDEQEHRTNEIIKCHSFNDLAVLKVRRSGVPLQLYDGVNIIRGKQVVAIGSPLGLFNTVSNGIVSGFRNIGEVSMIQFTAPTSHGSSGGALLDMFGRLIGIITAGFDDGQNLNLAVDYLTIYPFIKGFL